MKFRLLVLAAGFLVTGCAMTDHGPAFQQDAGGSPLVIRVDPQAQQAKLQIPKELLVQLRADAGQESPDFARMKTIATGLSLTMGLALAGVWLARHGAHTSGKRLALAIGVCTALSLGGVSLVWADLPPQPFFRRAPPQPTNDSVVLEVIERGNEINLVITREQLAKLKK